MTVLLIGVLPGMLAYVISREKWPSVAIGMGNILYIWLFLPVIAYNHYGTVWWIVINGLMFAGVAFFVKDEERKENTYMAGFFISFVSFVSGIMFIAPFISSPLVNLSDYRNLAGNIKATNTAHGKMLQGLVKINREDEKEIMENLVDLLQKERTLHNRVDIKTLEAQYVNKGLYWIGPLDHASFLDWIFNYGGTPGYVMIPYDGTTDVKIVRELHDKPLSLKYNIGAFFLHDPYRYVYFHGYATRGLTNWHFEVDDDGRPFYVATIFKKKFFFKGEEAVGILMLDVQTGEITEKYIGNIPAWVDYIHPVEFVHEQIVDRSNYIHGFRNRFHPKKDVLCISDDVAVIYDGDRGGSYWRVGFSLAEDSEELAGFFYVDRRTKEMVFYPQKEMAHSLVAGLTMEVKKRIARNDIDASSLENVIEKTQVDVLEISGVDPAVSLPTYSQTGETSDYLHGQTKGKDKTPRENVSYHDANIMGEKELNDTKNVASQEQRLPRGGIIKIYTDKKKRNVLNNASMAHVSQDAVRKDSTNASEKKDHTHTVAYSERKPALQAAHGEKKDFSAPLALKKSHQRGTVLRVNGVVLRIGQESTKSGIICYFLIQNMENKLFSVDVRLSREVFNTRPGHVVEISYEDSEGTIIAASSFVNKSITKQRAGEHTNEDRQYAGRK